MDLKCVLVSLITIVMFFSTATTVCAIGGGGVFKVQHKFSNRGERSLGALKEHDRRRHSRNLAGVDLTLHGNGKLTGTGLYYTQIGIGTPSNDYFVQVDTGSDIFWVNCIECTQCPKSSGLGVDLKLYDPHSSTTGELVTCDKAFCAAIDPQPVQNCSLGESCKYSLTYGDESEADLYFVKDLIKYDQVSGNLQTTSANASIILGCAFAETGHFVEDVMATDGIIGFGQSSTSVISQLASAKIVKKMFAHCLDSINGGGIFAIGNVVNPKFNTTPLVPNQPHYNVNLKTIEVNKDIIPTDVYGTQTVIDSGTTLAYLPEKLYDPLISKILASHPELQPFLVDGTYSCFEYTGSVDDFPTVAFHFENSLSLTVYPHEYMFQPTAYALCIGWQNSALLAQGVNNLTVLGDIVLSNKLVVYDLEKQAIGWTEYNCSSTIELQDDQSGLTYQVGKEKQRSTTPSAGSMLLGNATVMVFLFSILSLIL